MSDRAQARCRVTMTIEVIPHDVWGEDCTIDQARRQGIESARSLVIGVFKNDQRFRLLSIDDADVVTFQKKMEP